MKTEEILNLTKGYKFIQKNMTSKNGKHIWKVGKWYKVDKSKLKLCNFGFHACEEPLEVLEYVYGDKCFIVEARGKIINKKGDKFVASEMRLIKEIPIIVFKRFSLFCAKQCLPNYEKEYPNDSRVRDCIKAAEDYFDGKITLSELSAARSAAWSAAESAWSAAESAWSARSAAWSAESAAESAARSAARSAAWSARSAAESAWSAAWSARSAAWSAESAAESAAKKLQNKELKKLIKKYG